MVKSPPAAAARYMARSSSQYCQKFEKHGHEPLSEASLECIAQSLSHVPCLIWFSLNIVDIDPTYTLGDFGKAISNDFNQTAWRRAARSQSIAPMPFDIEHVLVIALEKAAGLGDFRADADRLASTGACIFIMSTPPFSVITPWRHPPSHH